MLLSKTLFPDFITILEIQGSITCIRLGEELWGIKIRGEPKVY